MAANEDDDDDDHIDNDHGHEHDDVGDDGGGGDDQNYEEEAKFLPHQYSGTQLGNFIIVANNIPDHYFYCEQTTKFRKHILC